MRVSVRLNAAGASHPGLHRDVNEDRFHSDPLRGVFVVVDGVGGQAAGGRAAEIARDQIRVRLERETGTVETRIREAITLANNEILRQASARPEWRGMACVLTVAVIDDQDVVVGHVGDTRLYKLRNGQIEKLTHDHSPVGEREDRRELSELEAMRHPRRNEVYRDVGSEPHSVTDAGFADVFRVPFEPDAALLVCSDGLSDCLTSTAIASIVEEFAGEPESVANRLIGAANKAGGKDNVTVVYVEGTQFVRGADTRELPRRAERFADPEIDEPAEEAAEPEPAPSARWRVGAIVILLLATIALSAYAVRERWLPFVMNFATGQARQIVVTPQQSIGAAIAAARPGDEVIVEPGEYRERVTMRSGVRVRSRRPHGALIRLPVGASETDAAVLAVDVTGAELFGFRIVGDAATPLGRGVLARNSDLTVSYVEVTGARHAAVEFSGKPGGSMFASEVHDNAGAGLVVRSGAAPLVANNVFLRNGTASHAPGAVFIEPDSRPVFTKNVFDGVAPESLAIPTGSDPARDNWFLQPPAAPSREPQRRPTSSAPRREGSPRR